MHHSEARRLGKEFAAFEDEALRSLLLLLHCVSQQLPLNFEVT